MRKLLLTICLTLWISLPLYAAEISDVDAFDEDGNLSVLRCIDKGNLDFIAFLNASIWNDTFKEGVIEPWNDVLYRNQCHANDVIGLVKQQDKIRKQIRDAFLTCKTEDIPRLKKAYNKFVAEIYYVRHIVDSNITITLPFEALNTGNFDEAVILDRNQIYSQMREKYVKEGMFNLSEFDDFFIGLEIKYQERVKNYIRCPNTSWESVEERWKEFVEFFTEDYGGLKEAGEDIARAANSLAEEAKTIKTIELFTGETSLGAWAGSFVKAQINDVEPLEGLTEIYDKLKKDLPNTEAPSITHKDFLNIVASEAKGFEKEKIKAEMMGEFKVLYGSSSQSVEIFVQTLNGTTDENTVGFLEILNSTYPELNRIEKGAGAIVDRQCPA